MHMRIVQGPDLIADLPDWGDLPIPRVGEYIFHPPWASSPDIEPIAGCVKAVTWRTHDRGPDGFVKTARPFVELSI